MTHMTKKAAIAALLLAAAGVTQTARAQDTGPIVPGLGVASVDAVVANSNAFRAAQQQRQTLYKPQIDQATARQQQLQAQLQPLIDKFNRDRAANAPQAQLAQEAQQIQALQQSGQQELNGILQPVALSEAYVNEQIGDKLDQAVKSAMARKKISLLVNPQAIIAAGNGYNINQDILTDLNALIPSAVVQPPAGWVPRDMREQRAQQAGAAPAATGRAQPQGR